MKKLLSLLLAGALAAPAVLSAAAFEGKVTMKMSGPRGTPAQVTFSLKEGFSRLDMTTEGRAAGIIFDAAKQEMTILMPEQKMFMTRPLARPPAAAGAAEGAAGAAVEVTTTKEKILGYDCVKYVATGKEGSTEIWVTDQLGAFLGMGGGPMGGMGGGRGGPGAGGPPPPQAWEQALMGKGVFPLRVVTSAGGKETFRMEATAIDKTALPAATFAPPADFQDIGAMMRGIPGLPPGMKLPGSR